MSARADEGLHLEDAATRDDLAVLVSRARRLDADGAARMVGHGLVLAIYVSPVHGSGMPVVLGLRTLALSRPSSVDTTVPLAALADRLARRADEAVTSEERVLPVPPVAATGVVWAGVAPPRHGWTPVGELAVDVVRRAAEAGVAEVAAGVPDGAGSAAVARLRAGVWGRPLTLQGMALDGADVPAGAAFAAHGLGFLPDDVEAAGPVKVLGSGPWFRLTTSRGHVLARRPLL